ncbi:MAG: (d)CMP kinase [Candidatus Merdivicinus sp.]
MISVAIDGPSGAGKSTIARAVARELGFLYIDTGALYRSIGFFVLESGRDPRKKEDVEACLSGIRLELRHVDGVQRVFLNEQDVSEKIRTPAVSMAASQVSAVPEVRAFLLELQRSMARENNVIMDGRDIGTVVLPDAGLKIFLTAAPEDRARRRFEELAAKGEAVTYEEVLRDVVQRDYNDTHRDISPLRQAADAVLADTTGFPLERSVALIRSLVEERLAGKGMGE